MRRSPIRMSQIHECDKFKEFGSCEIAGSGMRRENCGANKMSCKREEECRGKWAKETVNFSSEQISTPSSLLFLFIPLCSTTCLWAISCLRRKLQEIVSLSGRWMVAKSAAEAVAVYVNLEPDIAAGTSLSIVSCATIASLLGNRHSSHNCSSAVFF